MRKSPLKRGTKPLKRKARLKAKGGSRFPKRRCPEYVAWIRTRPCCIVRNIPSNAYCWPWTDAAHIRSRGAGGPDVGNVVPLCRYHHAEQHKLGIRSFEKLYGVDLKAEAARLAKVWQGEHFPNAST